MANVIDRARERIERDGWFSAGRCVPADAKAPRCMTNAVLYEFYQTHDRAEFNQAIDVLALEVGEYDLIGIWQFNDDPSTSLEDVLLVMKRASARLDEEARNG